MTAGVGKPLPPLRASLARVLACIEAELEAGRPFPRERLIAQQLGWRESSAADGLIGLVAAGRLVRVTPPPGSRRRWVFALPGDEDDHDAKDAAA